MPKSILDSNFAIARAIIHDNIVLFSALLTLYFYLIVVPCCGPKQYIAHYAFLVSFWSFEIGRNALISRKIL